MKTPMSRRMPELQNHSNAMGKLQPWSLLLHPGHMLTATQVAATSLTASPKAMQAVAA